MSRIALSGDAAGTGTFTIASPNSNNNRTLTIPDTSGTIALQNGVGVGKILQVVNARFTVDQNTSSSTLTASSVTATITPSSTSSRIFYCFNFNHQATGPSAPAAAVSAIFRNNSVNLTQSNAAISQLIYSLAAANIHHPITLCGVDSPSTTSATTYTLYHGLLSSGAGSTQSSIREWGAQLVTLMEIGP